MHLKTLNEASLQEAAKAAKAVKAAVPKGFQVANATVIIDPTRKQFDKMGPEVRAWLLGPQAWMWNAYDGVHREVMNAYPKLQPTGISIIMERDGNALLVMLTNTNMSTGWGMKLHEDSEAMLAQAGPLVQRHPIWKRLGLNPGRIQLGF